MSISYFIIYKISIYLNTYYQIVVAYIKFIFNIDKKLKEIK